jgi:hypothetical protein
LTQNLGQLKALYRDSQSNFWVNLRILGQPCEFYLGGLRPRPGRRRRVERRPRRHRHPLRRRMASHGKALWVGVGPSRRHGVW